MNERSERSARRKEERHTYTQITYNRYPQYYVIRARPRERGRGARVGPPRAGSVTSSFLGYTYKSKRAAREIEKECVRERERERERERRFGITFYICGLIVLKDY